MSDTLFATPGMCEAVISETTGIPAVHPEGPPHHHGRSPFLDSLSGNFRVMVSGAQGEDIRKFRSVAQTPVAPVRGSKSYGGEEFGEKTQMGLCGLFVLLARSQCVFVNKNMGPVCPPFLG